MLRVNNLSWFRVPGVISDEIYSISIKPLIDLEHGKLPDPVAEAIRLVLTEQKKLEERLEKLESSSGITAMEDELAEKRSEIEREFNQEKGT